MKELLHELETERRFVFHGSPIGGITALEVRQPYTLKDDVQTKDGPPSVCASPYADVAIFMAIVSLDRRRFGTRGRGRVQYAATRKALEAAKSAVGYVYVLPKEHFWPKTGNEHHVDWRSLSAEKPIQCIEVSYEDLPPEIQLIF